MQVNEENLVTVHNEKFKKFPLLSQNYTRTCKKWFCKAMQQPFRNKTLANEEKGVLLVGKTINSLEKHELERKFLLFYVFNMERQS